MKNLILGFFLIIVACNKKEYLNAEIEISVNSINKLNKNIFSQNCIKTELNIIELDEIDSLIFLINKCEKKKLGILAALRKYPDGELNVKSFIKNDTIRTFSNSSFIGNYENDYYEEIIDSVYRVWTIKDNEVYEIRKDSIRKIVKKEIIN